MVFGRKPPAPGATRIILATSCGYRRATPSVTAPPNECPTRIAGASLSFVNISWTTSIWS